MPVSLRDAKSVPSCSQAHVFRDVSHRGLLFGGIFFALLASYCALPKESGVNWGAVLAPGALALWLLAWGVWRCVYRTGDRWLLTAAAEGLYMNLGYVEGYPVHHDKAPALFVPREAIRAAGRVREILRLPHRFGATRHHVGCLDIVLEHPVSEQVQKEVARYQERCAEAGKSGPFPVRIITPALVRLCWSAIRPDETEALRCLASLCPVIPDRQVAFPQWDALNARQRDIFLDELWVMGMREEALFLARMHLGVSIKTASAIMEARFQDIETAEGA